MTVDERSGLGEQDSSRIGDWMHVWTGGRFYPLDPRPEEVRVEDITRGLAHCCRYAGQSNRFYSVAEHSVLMARALMRDGADSSTCLLALFHDSTEAYLGDIIRPLKRHPLMAGYRAAEERLGRVIATALGLPSVDPHTDPLVAEYDTRILHDEALALMRVDLEPWHELVGPGLGVVIGGWDPGQAVWALEVTAIQLMGGKRWQSLTEK